MVVMHLLTLKNPSTLTRASSPADLVKVVARLLTWAGVRANNKNTVFGSEFLAPSFGDEVLFSTGKARQPVHNTNRT